MKQDLENRIHLNRQHAVLRIDVDMAQEETKPIIDTVSTMETKRRCETIMCNHRDRAHMERDGWWMVLIGSLKYVI